MINLENKTILVTGASSGIGKAVCKEISEYGAKVIMVARREDKMREIMSSLPGGGHACYKFDLANIEKIEPLLKQIVDENGKLDGIVYCAGIALQRPLKLIKYDILHNVMLINFYAYFELTRVFSNKRYNTGHGSIVVMSSVSAHQGDKTQSAYGASKVAIEGSVKILAKELGDKKIRINAITAGMVKTQWYEVFLNKYGDSSLEKHNEKQYLGIIEKEDVAGAAAYLLSDASRFVTGTSFVIDGGFLT